MIRPVAYSLVVFLKFKFSEVYPFISQPEAHPLAILVGTPRSISVTLNARECRSLKEIVFAPIDTRPRRLPLARRYAQWHR